MNLEWRESKIDEESVREWTASDAFRPGDLVEWRAPIKGETPTPSAMGDQFMILSWSHIKRGMRVDASDFLVSVLAHYGIEWFHLISNSMTELSIFAHLCEAYLHVPPTVEVFVHFYQPISYYCKSKESTKTIGCMYFKLRDNIKMKKGYPMYFLKKEHSVWRHTWFYAKLPQSSPLTFRGDSLRATISRDVLPLSPEQKFQVLRIEELSMLGLTARDIVYNYLEHRISPLRARTHLACNYTGQTDPTRDSDKELSPEDMARIIRHHLDLEKMAINEPPNRSNGLSSLTIGLPAEQTKQCLGLLDIPWTVGAKEKVLMADLRKTRKCSKRSDKPQVPAIPGQRTRQAAGCGNTTVSPPSEMDFSPVQGHSEHDEEENIEAASTTITSQNRGTEMKSTGHQIPASEHAGIKDRKRAQSLKPIPLVIGSKRKAFAYPSGSQREAKTRISSSETGSVKGTSYIQEGGAPLKSLSLGFAEPSPPSSAGGGESGPLVEPATVVGHSMMMEDSHISEPNTKAAEDYVLHAIIDQHVQGSPEQFDPPEPNPEERNIEAVWERTKKVHSECASRSEVASSELLEEAKRLIEKNKLLKDRQTMLEQQVKYLTRIVQTSEDLTRFYETSVTKVDQLATKRAEENIRLKDDNRGQRDRIDELTKQMESTQVALVQKGTELNHLAEEVSGLKKDKEALQSLVSRANESAKTSWRHLNEILKQIKADSGFEPYLTDALDQICSCISIQATSINKQLSGFFAAQQEHVKQAVKFVALMTLVKLKATHPEMDVQKVLDQELQDDHVDQLAAILEPYASQIAEFVDFLEPMEEVEVKDCDDDDDNRGS